MTESKINNTKEVKKDSTNEHPDPHLVSQTQYINEQKFQTQKLIISLGTGSLVFSVSLLGLIPKSAQSMINHILMIGWFFLGLSIISGVMNLVFYVWWFGNKLMITWSKDVECQSDVYKRDTRIFGRIYKYSEGVSFISFIVAVFFIAAYAIFVF